MGTVSVKQKHVAGMQKYKGNHNRNRGKNVFVDYACFYTGKILLDEKKSHQYIAAQNNKGILIFL